MTTEDPRARPDDRTGPIARALGAIERAGNKLPEPAVLFLLLAALVVLASFVGARRHLAAVHPETNTGVAVTNLLSAEGFRRLASEAVKSFGALSQLGTAIPVLLGLGVAERSGLLRVALSAAGRHAPSWALTAGLFFVALHAGVAGDTGLLLVPPLGALLFLAMGRHPIAGLAAGFAGVTSGYGAGFLLTSLDASLAASTAAAAGSGPSVGPAATYFLGCAATVVLTAAGVLVNRFWVEPRLGEYMPEVEGTEAAAPGDMGSPTRTDTASPAPVILAATPAEEARALRFAGIATLATLAVIAALVVPEGGLLRDASGSPRPFFDALPAIALGVLLVAAAVFGRFSGSIPDQAAFLKTASKAASDLGPYLVLALVASQLLAALNASNLPQVLAIKGSRAVSHAHLSGLPLAMGTVGLVAFLGLVLPSASARWAMMASALVPLFVASGYSPESAQAAFRAGMSPALALTPAVPYYVVLVAFAKRFDRRSGTGTLLAVTLPYALAFGLAWALLLALWLGARLPLGPG